MTNDLILGTAVGYNVDTIRPFIVSLLTSGYHGRIVLFLEDPCNDTARFLRKHSVEIRPYKTSHFPINIWRFFLYLQFLKQEHSIDRIMITDVRDVIFQDDPFVICTDDKLYCFEEDRSMTLSTCTFNSQWILQAYGRNILYALGHNPIICAGVTIASCKKIQQYLEIICKEIETLLPIWGIDQSAHNVLVRSGRISDTVIYTNESGPVYTLAHVKTVKTDNQGFIINDYGIPSVIHQYDRHPDLQIAIHKKYSEENNSKECGLLSDILCNDMNDISLNKNKYNLLTNTTMNHLSDFYNNKLAIIVPYRNRADHLNQFLSHMLCYFKRDKLDRHIKYTIHIIEQLGKERFNRGKIKNCGFSITQNNADYFCFHDIDYLPIWADYSYCEKPVRLIWYGLIGEEDHDDFFGGVVMLNKHDFIKINGYSNDYWGWGPEDLELGIRCKITGLDFDKRDGTYIALPHEHEGFTDNGSWTEEAEETHELFQKKLKSLPDTFTDDGLSSLKFELVQSKKAFVDGERRDNIFHHKVLI